VNSFLTQIVYAIARAAIDAYLDAIAESKTAEFVRSSDARRNAYRERLRRWQSGADTERGAADSGAAGQGKGLLPGRSGDSAKV
jgi:anti-sigma factor RsiW